MPHTSRFLRALVLGVGAAALAVVAGCSAVTDGLAASAGVPADAPAEPDATLAQFEAIAQEALDAAERDGISAEQQALVQQALETGQVTFEDYRAAQQATFECFEDAGIRYEAMSAQTVDGIPRVEYMFEAPASGESSVADACILEHSDVVDTLYILQPSSIEAADAAFEAGRAEALACLGRHGVAIETDAERAQIQQAYIAALEEWFALRGDTEPPPIRECNDLV